ncbi:hypothetical protein [Pimelobacter simplex]|uniref:hypothetical protein n=1 Tax=Nocardioides simplex TaxID=2045 RepID=UPI00214F8E0A|nr:hypothetical protein [Pimelobacter simplex]UUW88354.1 hypothetical protein M0M43_21780 [Pimelobacter simplex]UUW97858.1 hypothetical protein M0M48_10425 [Pimelobacter simplex]
MTHLAFGYGRLINRPSAAPTPDDVATAVLTAAVTKAKELVRSNLGAAARNVLNDAIRTANTVLEVA